MDTFYMGIFTVIPFKSYYYRLLFILKIFLTILKLYHYICSWFCNKILTIYYLYLRQIFQEFLLFFSLKKIEVIKDIISDFSEWLEQLNIEESDRDKLKDMRCFKKLLCVVQILESSVQAQRSFQSRNKVAPSLTGMHFYDIFYLIYFFYMINSLTSYHKLF